MRLDWNGWLRHRSINARSLLMGGVLELIATPVLLLVAWLLCDLRLALFATLFAQCMIVATVLYLRTRMLENGRQRERDEALASMLRRAPI